MALELAADDPSYKDIASKFFEHFVSITDAMNSLGGMGPWDEQDWFCYVLNANGTTLPCEVAAWSASSHYLRSKCWNRK